MQRKKLFLLFALILVLNIAHLFSYTITSSVVDSVGNKSTGGTYELISAGGQTAIGNSNGGSYSMETGFINTTIAPKAITNLTASQGSYVGAINLTWTYPETLIAGSSYYIQYSTFNSDTVWNCNNAQVIASTSVTAGTSQNITISGFDVGRGSSALSYPIISPNNFFRVWVRNGDSLFSNYSNYASTYANTPALGIDTLTNYSDGWLSVFNNGSYNGYDLDPSVAIDVSGNIYITETNENNDVTIKRYNSSGIIEWTKFYNDSANSVDVGNGITIDSLNNIYVIGIEYRTDLSQGRNILVRKYDANGSFQWANTYNGISNSDDYGNDICIDDSGNVYATGITKMTTGGDNIWIRKYDTNGLIQWTTYYNSPNNSYDYGYGIISDNLGNIYVTGTEYRNDLGQNFNIWIRQYDNSNPPLIEWTTTYNSSVDGEDVGRSIVLDVFGNIFVSGYEVNSGFWLRKYDINRNIIWTKTNYNFRAEHIATDNLGNIYVTGCNDGKAWTGKFNTDGLTQWTTSFNCQTGKVDYTKDLKVDNLGNVYVTGFEWVSEGGHVSDTWLRKYSQSYLTQPSLSSLNVTTNTITFNWNDSNYESSYTITTADFNTVISTLNPNTTNYTLSGLSPNSSTSVYITAYNTWASSSSALITTYTLSNPATGSYIISSDDYKIKIGWGGNNNPAYTRWGVLRSTDTNFTSTTTIKDFTDNYTQTTYSDKNVLPETTYYYKICAYNNNQVITNYDTVISTLTLPKDEKIVINEIASCEGTDMIEFYVSQTGAYGGYTVYEGTACIKTFPNSGDWVNGNMINGTYIMLYLNSPAGTDETEINGSLIKIYSDYTGINATDNIIYLSSSNGLGFKADGVVSATSTVVDIVAYANQDLTELSSAYKNNIASMTTIGLWNYEGIEPKQIDCVNSRGLTTAGRGIARDDVSRRSGDKYDWMYMNILSTGGINIATTSVSGLGGASTSTPTGLGVIIGTTTTVTINYISTSTYSDIGHMITIDIPNGWTEPQITDPYSAGYTTTTFDFADNYWLMVSTGITGIAGRIIVPLGTDLTTGTTISIKYGDISVSTGGYAIAQNTIGRAVFLVSSDKKGTNVEPITSCSPEIRVTDAYGGGGAPRFVGPNPDFVLGEVYSFPNPAKRGKFPTIHIECGIADRVVIGIYNVAAEPIHSTELGGLPLVINNPPTSNFGGASKYAYEYTWDITDIASGVYVYIIRAKKTGFSDIKAQGKTAII